MQDLNSLLGTYKPTPTPFKTRRDEILSEHIGAINAERKEYCERVGKKYEPISKKDLAIRINQNPKLAGDDNNGELELLLRQCKDKGSYYWFWAVTKPKWITK